MAVAHTQTGPQPKKRTDERDSGNRRSGDRRSGDRRTAARVLAVQALYQIDMTAAEPAAVAAEFLAHRLDTPAQGKGAARRIAKPLFQALVHGVGAAPAALDARLAPCLAEGWTMARLDPVLRAMLRCGAYELAARKDLPAPAVISAYVDVARVFFGGGEAGLVNAVLDCLARRLGILADDGGE